MKRLLLAAATILPVCAGAQATLTAALAPPLNSIHTFYDANVPPGFTFSKTGTTNTWDFTTVTPVPGADDTTFIVSPSSIPGGSSFPTATHCWYDDASGSSFTMVKIDASGVTMLGSVADITGSGTPVPLQAVPPLVAMSFPYSYGSSGSGTAYFELYGTGNDIGQPSIDSVRFKSTINGQRDVIAAGTLIIPSGSFPAILERSIDNNIDSLWVKGSITLNQWTLAPGFPQTTTDSAFYWYTDQSLIAYAHALYDNTGLHDVNYFKSSTTNVATVNGTPSLNIYPNPSSEFLNLEYGKGHLTVNLYNSCGTLVSSEPATPQMNVSSLENGMYLLRISDDAGNTNTVRFIKE